MWRGSQTSLWSSLWDSLSGMGLSMLDLVTPDTRLLLQNAVYRREDRKALVLSHAASNVLLNNYDKKAGEVKPNQAPNITGKESFLFGVYCSVVHPTGGGNRKCVWGVRRLQRLQMQWSFFFSLLCCYLLFLQLLSDFFQTFLPDFQYPLCPSFTFEGNKLWLWKVVQSFVSKFCITGMKNVACINTSKWQCESICFK